MEGVTMEGATVEQQSRFLTIPGEIRIRIYEIAVEDANACQKSDLPESDQVVEDLYDWAMFYHRIDMLPRLISPKRNKYARLATPNQLKSWSGLRRTYLGLSQTCSQIRREFLPAYSMVCTGVDLEDLSDYLRVFVVQRGGGVTDYRGNIDIGVEANNGFEFRDALILINESPNVRVQFSSREMEEYTELDADGCESELEGILLYTQCEYPKFWEFLLTRTSSLRLGIMSTREFSDIDGMSKQSHYVSNIEIWVKAEFAEDWMHKGFCTGKENDQWQSELELPERAIIYLAVANRA
ncbi:hypothetical protein E8E12_004744 [Didymella heteroderae]|uniref:Uncharacterized protein n=1 Tax=Didymella heteroderae TaxID=1769908 RepID=A0A9P4WMZ0_9PLEO|nr:hypothetical protein E8E12_004744 [Didymella heteroderae]